ncbi:MAG: hypothetical protein LBN35_00385 [Clostridiales Family XIII bacterium]|nr:hypothetical protein [Clostridiales Family XIII bacterium]
MKVQKYLLTTLLIATLIVSGLALGACSKDKGNASSGTDDKVIKFAVCNLKAYEDTTKVLAEEVKKLGYTLDYTLLADNTQINESVESGEYFANYHQHTPYMDEFNKTHSAHLAAAFPVFTDTAGIWSTKYKDINELPDGARISVPNDPGNNFRTFVILADAGLLTLKDGVSETDITKNDIIGNPKNFEFIEVDYTMLARSIEEADAGFLYATVAAEIGLTVNDALLLEREDLRAADIIAVREENIGSEKAEILKKAYYTDAVKQAFLDTYDGKDILVPAW